MTDDGRTPDRQTRIEWLSPLLVLTLLGLGLTAIVVAGALLVAPPEIGKRSVANLPEVEQTAKRKDVFIEFLEPVIRTENRRVAEQRQRVLELLTRLERGRRLAEPNREWLDRMAERYRVDADEPTARARALKIKVDIVPVELALAQGALESAWGTSRFARQGNNLFGEWCFKPGCGIVPKRRPAGKTYEVQAFDGVGGSVRSYIHNLNSHPAFAPMRRIRAQARAAGRELDGYEMAGGLYNYAGIGHKYVEHIRGVIERNGLQRLAESS